MGQSICSRHGLQATGFAAPAIAVVIDAGEVLPLATLFWIDVYYIGIRWQCPVNSAFLCAHHLDPVDHETPFEINDEDRAERILAAMSAVCAECLYQYAGRRHIRL